MQPSPPQGLLSIAHFHLKAGQVPTSWIIPPGMEWVELMTHGRAWCWNGSEWIELGPGDLIWQMPGDCTTGRADPQVRYRSLAVKFRSCARKGQRRIPRFSRWNAPYEVAEFIEEILARYTDPAFDRPSLLWYVFSRLHFKARQWHHELSRQQSDPALERVRKLIDTQYARQLTVGDLAAETEWTDGHFHERFRLAFGMTPYEAISRKRMQAARELLAGSDLPVKRIALETGFRQVSVFCHAFRRHMGESPTMYRNRHYNSNPGALCGEADPATAPERKSSDEVPVVR